MIALFLNPLVLCALLWLVARNSADFYFAQVFFLALGIGIAGALLGIFLGILSLIPLAALTVFLLMWYCGITLGQAVLVTALYFAYQVGLSLLLG